MSLPEDYLSEIEARVDAAPKRPVHMEMLQPEVWEIWKEEDCHVTYGKFYSEAAAMFFCEALKDVPILVREVRRLQAELDARH